MSRVDEKIKSLKADCEECGAEVVFTPLYSPPFREMSPTCPFCHFPLTPIGTDELDKLIERLQSYRQEVAA